MQMTATIACSVILTCEAAPDWNRSASDIRHRLVAVVPLLVLLVSGRFFGVALSCMMNAFSSLTPFSACTTLTRHTPTRATNSVSSGIIRVVHFFGVSRRSAVVENQFAN
jgi:hypothetical protein